MEVKKTEVKLVLVGGECSYMEQIISTWEVQENFMKRV